MTQFRMLMACIVASSYYVMVQGIVSRIARLVTLWCRALRTDECNYAVLRVLGISIVEMISAWVSPN